MKKYDSYKDSGVEWIGKIPSHWDIVRLKTYCSLKGRIGWNGLRSDEFKEASYAYLVTGQDFNSSNIIWSNCYQIDKNRYDEDPFIQLSNGDLLITKDGTIGKIAKVANLDKPACLNSGIFVMKQKQPMFSQGYLYWLLCSDLLKGFNKNTSSGTTILHLYQNVFEKMPMIVPSMNEQQAIADYLDSQTARIDNIIKARENKINLLEELRTAIISKAVTKGFQKNVETKDSGIEWIGQIPKHWEMSAFKRFLREPMKYGANESAEFDNPEWPRYIRITDIDEKGNLKKETFKSLPPEKAKDYPLEDGDVLFARSGATVGKTYIHKGNISACYAGYLIKAKCKNVVLPEFLFYYTQTNAYENWKNSVFIQATIQNIGADKYSLMPIVVPPLEEQRKIIAHVENRIVSLGNAIKKAESEILLLKEYRSSLITEVVTGKRKVV